MCKKENTKATEPPKVVGIATTLIESLRGQVPKMENIPPPPPKKIP